MEQSAREQPDPDDQEETQLQDESGIIGDASTASNCDEGMLMKPPGPQQSSFSVAFVSGGSGSGPTNECDDADE